MEDHVIVNAVYISYVVNCKPAKWRSFSLISEDKTGIATSLTWNISLENTNVNGLLTNIEFHIAFPLL